MTGQDGLWSALEVRTQAEQVRGQLTVWDCLDDVGLTCAGDPTSVEDAPPSEGAGEVRT